MKLITPKMLEEVEEAFEFAMDKLGHDFDVKIEFNYRYTRVLGRAIYRCKGKPSQILLSAKLWPRATEKQRRETVIHEACHLVAYHEANGKKIRPHGLEWQSLMLKCGVRPERCHTVDIDGLSKRRPVKATCECEKPHYLSKRKARRILDGEIKCRCTTRLAEKLSDE